MFHKDPVILNLRSKLKNSPWNYFLFIPVRDVRNPLLLSFSYSYSYEKSDLIFSNRFSFIGSFLEWVENLVSSTEERSLFSFLVGIERVPVLLDGSELIGSDMNFVLGKIWEISHRFLCFFLYHFKFHI